MNPAVEQTTSSYQQIWDARQAADGAIPENADWGKWGFSLCAQNRCKKQVLKNIAKC